MVSGKLYWYSSTSILSPVLIRPFRSSSIVLLVYDNLRLYLRFQAYLSAIIVYLMAGDLKQAQQCHNDCSQ